MKGNPELVVEYKNKFYAFSDLSKLGQFMTSPDRFADLPLPRKLPPPAIPVNLQALPVMGYLEQSVSSSISKSLLSLVRSRPKLPKMSLQKSALCFLALHLKGILKIIH